MTVRRTELIMQLERLQEGLMEQFRYEASKTKKTKEIVAYAESVNSLGKYNISPYMSIDNKIYLLRAIFIMKGHMHRHLKNNSVFPPMSDKLDEIEKSIRGWRNETE